MTYVQKLKFTLTGFRVELFDIISNSLNIMNFLQQIECFLILIQCER